MPDPILTPDIIRRVLGCIAFGRHPEDPELHGVYRFFVDMQEKDPRQFNKMIEKQLPQAHEIAVVTDRQERMQAALDRARERGSLPVPQAQVTIDVTAMHDDEDDDDDI